MRKRRPPGSAASKKEDCSLLYHYTSEQGLLGIIGNDNIRATHIRFLNDSTEFREAFTEKYVRILAFIWANLI
jgi:hypothetical protein